MSYFLVSFSKIRSPPCLSEPPQKSAHRIVETQNMELAAGAEIMPAAGAEKCKKTRVRKRKPDSQRSQKEAKKQAAEADKNIARGKLEAALAAAKDALSKDVAARNRRRHKKTVVTIRAVIKIDPTLSKRSVAEHFIEHGKTDCKLPPELPKPPLTRDQVCPYFYHLFDDLPDTQDVIEERNARRLACSNLCAPLFLFSIRVDADICGRRIVRRDPGHALV